jgi:hypothetical protein
LPLAAGGLMGGEELEHCGLDFGGAGAAVEARAHDAVAIDEEGDGDAVDASVLAAELGIAHHDRVVEAHPGDEGADGAFSVVDGDTDNLQAAGAVLLLPLDEAGNLEAAGRAPGGPEIEQNHFAAETGEIDAGALKIGAGKLRSGVVDERALGVRCAKRDERCQENGAGGTAGDRV